MPGWNEFRIIHDDKPFNYSNNNILKNRNIIILNYKTVKLNLYSLSLDFKKLGENLFPLIYYSKLFPLHLNDRECKYSSGGKALCLIQK